MALLRLLEQPQSSRFLAFRARNILECASGQLSNDPLLVDKVRDIVGLYVNPPHHAVVLCGDEKSQIQGWAVVSRSFRCCPAESSDELTITNAMAQAVSSQPDIATGSVIGKRWPFHRTIKFRKF